MLHPHCFILSSPIVSSFILHLHPSSSSFVLHLPSFISNVPQFYGAKTRKRRLRRLFQQEMRGRRYIHADAKWCSWRCRYSSTCIYVRTVSNYCRQHQTGTRTFPDLLPVHVAEYPLFSGILTQVERVPGYPNTI